MDIKEAVRIAIKELMIPELDKIKEENKEIKTTLVLTNKRLDDLNVHLADQSRRIDETNKRIDELNKRIDETNKRIDETNDRIDALRVELRNEIAYTNKRIDETNNRIDETNNRINETNQRIDRLYEVIVRREEHFKLDQRVANLEREVNELKKKLVA